MGGHRTGSLSVALASRPAPAQAAKCFVEPSAAGRRVAGVEDHLPVVSCECDARRFSPIGGWDRLGQRAAAEHDASGTALCQLGSGTCA